MPAKNPKLNKRGELTVFVPIYNAKLGTSSSPDVMVEYNFTSRRMASKFFNKTQPQATSTRRPCRRAWMPRRFTRRPDDSFSSFPEGRYRLEMKITDKLTTKSLTREAPGFRFGFVNTGRWGRAPLYDHHDGVRQNSGVGGGRQPSWLWR